MVEPDSSFVSSWGFYTCKKYCSIDHYKSGETDGVGICSACSSICASCENSADNCIFCKYSNSFTNPPPTCSCLAGSRLLNN